MTNPIEEADGYKRLMNEFDTPEKVAKFIGKNRAHIANCLRPIIAKKCY